VADRRPVFTENFSANLTAIRIFLGPEREAVFQQFLNRLFDEIVPTLCRFPQAGRSFLAHSIHSTTAKALVGKLRGRLKKGDELREFVVDDYLLLYLNRGSRLVFLSVKHHRQLSFDLKRFWE
jgi:hypothetical protein